jgi:hypothetical protein
MDQKAAKAPRLAEADEAPPDLKNRDGCLFLKNKCGGFGSFLFS